MQLMMLMMTLMSMMSAVMEKSKKEVQKEDGQERQKTRICVAWSSGDEECVHAMHTQQPVNAERLNFDKQQSVSAWTKGRQSSSIDKTMASVGRMKERKERKHTHDQVTFMRNEQQKVISQEDKKREERRKPTSTR